MMAYGGSQADSGIVLRTVGAKNVRRFALLLAHHPGRVYVPRWPMRISSLTPHINLLRRNARRQRGQHLGGEVFLNSL